MALFLVCCHPWNYLLSSGGHQGHYFFGHQYNQTIHVGRQNYRTPAVVVRNQIAQFLPTSNKTQELNHRNGGLMMVIDLILSDKLWIHAKMYMGNYIK